VALRGRCGDGHDVLPLPGRGLGAITAPVQTSLDGAATDSFWSFASGGNLHTISVARGHGLRLVAAAFTFGDPVVKCLPSGQAEIKDLVPGDGLNRQMEMT
jgi:hypothetical protein